MLTLSMPSAFVRSFIPVKYLEATDDNIVTTWRDFDGVAAGIVHLDIFEQDMRRTAAVTWVTPIPLGLQFDAVVIATDHLNALQPTAVTIYTGTF
jgi:hypothetical protein